MRVIRFIGVTCAVATLAGCSWSKQQLHRHDNDYLQGSGQVAHMDKPGHRAMQMGEYYPVPAGGKVDAKRPSTVPPGSNIQTSQAKSTSISKNKTTELVKQKSGDETLMVASNNTKAWATVGKALKASGYQVLDQDSDMGAYFILDAKATEDKITNKTPILRVNLKATQDKTAVTLASHDNGHIDVAIQDRILQSLQQQLG